MLKWNERLWLLSPEEVESCPDGTVFESVNGDLVVKGKDYIDDDTKFSASAYGITKERNEKLLMQMLVCR